MRVLVIGSGAREHALCLALSADPVVTHLACAPGNAGSALIAEQREVDLSDPAAIADLAADLSSDLVVIGPELPLVRGAADAVRQRGIACFGPSALAARIEGSKAFAKDVMTAAKVPTSDSVTCDNVAEVSAALDRFGPPYVIKADGLASGKGVLVTSDRAAALDHASRCAPVVVEEFLAGPEVSLFCLTDGSTIVPLLPAQDHKRVFDDDAGPNTGGMGAYCPLNWAPSDLVDQVVTEIAQPTLAELAQRGTPFSGVLYIGLALTASGPKVIEFNARFGDPETQVVLPLLENPFAELLNAVATSTLAEHPPLRWRAGAAVTVVLAAPGYPENPRTGDEITGSESPGVLHAGTRSRADGVVISNGGRVLSIVATAPDVAKARESAYATLSGITLAGGHYRRDIALRAVQGQVKIPAQ